MLFNSRACSLSRTSTITKAPGTDTYRIDSIAPSSVSGFSKDAPRRCQPCPKTPNCWSCAAFRGDGMIVGVITRGEAQRSCVCILKMQQ